VKDSTYSIGILIKSSQFEKKSDHNGEQEGTFWHPNNFSFESFSDLFVTLHPSQVAVEKEKDSDEKKRSRREFITWRLNHPFPKPWGTTDFSFLRGGAVRPEDEYNELWD
jgi:hypothetical protein